MADSEIEWTDKVWNPVRGCVKVSPGCAHCYAETLAERFRGVKGHAYEQGFDLRLVPEKLAEPLSWKKPRRVFVNSMSDLFQDGVPDSYIDQVFAVMALAPQHTFQVLTKRADRMLAYVTRLSRDAKLLEAGAREVGWTTLFRGVDGQSYSLVQWPLPNVWLGVSVENQHFADERIPLLLQTPAAVRFISAEPLLGPVDLRYSLGACLCRLEPHGKACPAVNPKLDWVIVGGESGHGARPFDVTWARSIVAQCTATGVPCFIKQLGAKPFDSLLAWKALNRQEADPATMQRVGAFYRNGKWGNPAEWPEDLRVRQFPSVRAAAPEIP